MGDIEKVNNIIKETALPKAEVGSGFMMAIIGETRSMAYYLGQARNALRNEILPLIKEVALLDEDLYRQLGIAANKSDEATETVHSVLEGTKTQEDYDALVEPVRQALTECEPSLRSSTAYVSKIEASIIGLADSLDSSSSELHRTATYVERNPALSAVGHDLRNSQI